MTNVFKSTHNLPFEVAESKPIFKSFGYKNFRVGTCEGLWGDTGDSFFILSVINSQEGNGHFQDVLEWFEYSCKNYGKNLLVIECMNEKLYERLIKNNGFKPLDKNKENVIKVFNNESYHNLLKNGNRILMKGSLKCI